MWWIVWYKKKFIKIYLSDRQSVHSIKKNTAFVLESFKKNLYTLVALAMDQGDDEEYKTIHS